MSDQGIARIGNYIWDDTNKKWVPETQVSLAVSSEFRTVQISGITPVDGKLPVDTEITIEGNVIVQDVKVKTAPLTEVYASGTFPVTDNGGSLTVDIPDGVGVTYLPTITVSGIQATTDWEKLERADDLVTIIQYNEADSRTTVSGITYSSSIFGLTAYETFASGTNTLTIMRA